MTSTAVQLRTSSANVPTSSLLYGTPHKIIPGKLGPMALFSASQIVAYLVSTRKPRLFVFRTLADPEPLVSLVPGVHPNVRLLLEMCTAGRIQRVGKLFASLVKTGWDPSLLSDGFFVRIGLVLGGRLPAHTSTVRSLLRHENREGSL